MHTHLHLSQLSNCRHNIVIVNHKIMVQCLMLTLCIVCLDYVTVISQSSYLLPSHCPWSTLVIISCTHCKFSHALLKWTLLKIFVVVESLN